MKCDFCQSEGCDQPICFCPCHLDNPAGQTWWDDATIVLLAHTGDLELAEQFARWCQSVHDSAFGILGIAPGDFTGRTSGSDQ